MDCVEGLLNWMKIRYSEIAPQISAINQALWTYAEPSGEEYRSARLLEQTLRDNGFTVTVGVCGHPTAFVADYGTGKPVVAFLGEYDALPGLSQAAGVPAPTPLPGGGCGHGCGHCALGSGSLAAALLAHQYLEEKGLPGTVRYYGCCSEETDGVKPYMARAGLFNDVDCVFAWHPGGETGVPNVALAAMESFQVIFTQDSEDRADRTLEACELTNVAVNYLREHVPSGVRMHYAYLDAGRPAAEKGRFQNSLAYTVRAPRARAVEEAVQRVRACARGAAKMTGTACEIRPQSRYADRFQNSVVAALLSEAAQAVGPPAWDAADQALARAFTARYDGAQSQALRELIRRKYGPAREEERMACPLDSGVEPFDPAVCRYNSASSDVGDVGYAAPTASMRVACAALGTPAHSWFMTGMIGSSIGEKGIACAAQILALAAIRVFEEPRLLAGAQEERLRRVRGG